MQYAVASSLHGNRFVSVGEQTIEYADFSVTPEADLAITKDDGQETATPGDPVSYTITVTNHGPTTLAGLTVVDEIPAALQGPVFSSSAGAYDPDTGEWTGLNLAAGQSLTLTLDATIDAAATGALTNTATVFVPAETADPNLWNNTATDVDLLTVADLQAGLDDGQTSCDAGQPVNYTITVTNHGPNRVTSLVLVDTVPAELQGPVFTPSTGSYDPVTDEWTGLDLAAGESVTMSLEGTVDIGASGTLVVGVSVAPPAGYTDPDPNNDDATDENVIIGVDVIFMDGFESGDVSAWSGSVGLSAPGETAVAPESASRPQQKRHR
jgi:uncharacterized repeat protein (TIGR01451 family)